MLKVEGLCVSYGAVPVVADVDIVVNEGESVALLGPNGAGKTTIIKCIYGEVRASSGKIYFDGKEIQDFPIHKRIKLGISVIPEGRYLFPYLTVTESLILGAINTTSSKKFEMLEYIFQLFPALKERKNSQAITLSGGEQQMLTIGRALMASPKLLLIDEPSVGLAPKVVAEIYKILEKITHGKRNMSILLAEQFVNVKNITQRCYLIYQGKIVLEKKAEEIDVETLRKFYLGL